MLTRRQRKKIRRILLIFITTAILVVAGIYFYRKETYRKVRFTRYPEFGISIPENYSIHGIDVSRYQSTIAWEAVREMSVKDIRLGFAFIKATEGIGNTDPLFRRNWKKSREAGICRGAYHFFIASKDGKMQAENFISRVELEPGDLPPVLDIEQLNGTTTAGLRREAKRWLEAVESFYQVKPIIYTNVDFYRRNLGAEFDNYPLWVAHYYQSEQPRISRGWVFWQHSDIGRVNGIVPRVDFNVFNGDSLAFKNLLIR